MFLGDLIGVPVREGGTPLGYLADVRLFVPDRTPGQQVGTPELFGIVVCPRRAGSFLGYERTDVNAPALLARFFRWRSRGSFLVRWPDIAECGELGVDLRPGAARWSAALP
ncbi:hypothetical protein [Propionicimonas sp.]|uniref:hypothetical protein n=1 Tax=Propionicimonas sp. TaxID=1955623 RepID=UPI0039E35A0A